MQNFLNFLILYKKIFKLNSKSIKQFSNRLIRKTLATYFYYTISPFFVKIFLSLDNRRLLKKFFSFFLFHLVNFTLVRFISTPNAARFIFNLTPPVLCFKPLLHSSTQFPNLIPSIQTSHSIFRFLPANHLFYAFSLG